MLLLQAYHPLQQITRPCRPTGEDPPLSQAPPVTGSTHNYIIWQINCMNFFQTCAASRNKPKLFISSLMSTHQAFQLHIKTGDCLVILRRKKSTLGHICRNNLKCNKNPSWKLTAEIPLTQLSDVIWLGNIRRRFNGTWRSISFCNPLRFPCLEHTINIKNIDQCALQTSFIDWSPAVIRS